MTHQKQIRELNKLKIDLEHFRIKYFPESHGEARNAISTVDALIDQTKEYVTVTH